MFNISFWNPTSARLCVASVASSLIVSWSFSKKKKKKSIWLSEIEAAMTLEVKSTTLNEMWDLLPPVQLCDCEIIEQKGGEGYLTDQPWSLVAAQSVIVNTYLLHVNHGACLIIHSLTCERQHVNTPAHALLLCSVLWCIAKICPGREKEKKYEGLKKDRK